MNFFLVTVCVAFVACELVEGGLVRKNKGTADECKDIYLGFQTCKDWEALYDDRVSFCEHYDMECCKTCRRYKADSESLVRKVLEDLLKIESHH